MGKLRCFHHLIMIKATKKNKDHFVCIMNAWCDVIHEYQNKNDANQSISAMHLCPIDLKKLHSLIPFDIMKRYKMLQAFYQRHGMKQQSKWIKEIISEIG